MEVVAAGLLLGVDAGWWGELGVGVGPVRQCLAEDDPTTTGEPCVWEGNVAYPSDPTQPAGMTNRDVYTALEKCQKAYYFGEFDAPQCLECTKGLYADESRTTDYDWKGGAKPTTSDG